MSRAPAVPPCELEWSAAAEPGIIARLIDRAGGAVFALVLRASVLHADPMLALSIARAPRLIAWSGSLADEPFSRDPRTWGPAGLAALDAALARWEEPLRQAGVRLLLRPHARHILCDPQRCLSWLARQGAGPFGLALEPAALIDRTMLRDRDDHLRRVLGALGTHAELLIRSDIVPDGDTDDERSVPRGSPGSGWPGAVGWEAIERELHIAALPTAALSAADLE